MEVTTAATGCPAFEAAKKAYSQVGQKAQGLKPHVFSTASGMAEAMP
jgi:hypothetical protein